MARESGKYWGEAGRMLFFVILVYIYFFFSLAVCHPQKTNWCFINREEGEDEPALGN